MSSDINKTLEALGSLDNLHDIITPEPIGLFPLAPGWYIVLLLLSSYTLHLGFKKYKTHQKNLYRREAGEALKGLKIEKSSALWLISLMKRVGLSAYGREVIAQLSGESWWDFIEDNSNAVLDQELRVQVDRLLYQPEYEIDSNTYSMLLNTTTIWIETHKVASND